jgi:hypothetical protein
MYKKLFPQKTTRHQLLSHDWTKNQYNRDLHGEGIGTKDFLSTETNSRFRVFLPGMDIELSRTSPWTSKHQKSTTFVALFWLTVFGSPDTVAHGSTGE